MAPAPFEGSFVFPALPFPHHLSTAAPRLGKNGTATRPETRRVSPWGSRLQGPAHRPRRSVSDKSNPGPFRQSGGKEHPGPVLFRPSDSFGKLSFGGKMRGKQNARASPSFCYIFAELQHGVPELSLKDRGTAVFLISSPSRRLMNCTNSHLKASSSRRSKPGLVAEPYFEGGLQVCAT